jgi:hypothetical protein
MRALAEVNMYMSNPQACAWSNMGKEDSRR